MTEREVCIVAYRRSWWQCRLYTRSW